MPETFSITLTSVPAVAKPVLLQQDLRRALSQSVHAVCTGARSCCRKSLWKARSINVEEERYQLCWCRNWNKIDQKFDKSGRGRPSLFLPTRRAASWTRPSFHKARRILLAVAWVVPTVRGIFLYDAPLIDILMTHRLVPWSTWRDILTTSRQPQTRKPANPTITYDEQWRRCPCLILTTIYHFSWQSGPHIFQWYYKL